jgi:polar amino acid transport system substrate-binding protein
MSMSSITARVAPVRLAGLAAVIAFAVAITGCGSSNDSKSSDTSAPAASTPASDSSSSGAISLPANIKSAGKITVCSDETYPPEEYLEGGKAVGSDVDMGNALGQVLGVQFQFQNTGFDGIIAALLAKRCDVVISGLTQTPEREKQLLFTHYLDAGMGLLVKKGNPSGINSLDSLSGKRVAVETGTTEKDVLAKKNKELAKAGKPEVKITIFSKDTDAAQALATGKVDAYFTDAPPAAYYIKKAPDKFEFGGPQVESAPIGIGMRKSDTELKAALDAAVKKIYADGTMAKILAKWEMSSFAMKG